MLTTAHVGLEKLTTEAVDWVFHDCLWEEHNASYIDVEGVLTKARFAQKSIEQYRSVINSFLCQLPTAFRKNRGGGWSFLNLCQDSAGNQWADLHQTIDKLVCLGKAIGCLSTTGPEWNPIMPGGMPFVFVDVENDETGLEEPLPTTVAGPLFSFVLVDAQTDHQHPAVAHLLLVASRWAGGETLHVLTTMEQFRMKLQQELDYMAADDYDVSNLQLQWLDEKRVLAMASRAMPVTIYATVGLTPNQLDS